MTFVDEYLSEIDMSRNRYPIKANDKKIKSIERFLTVSGWDANENIPIMLYLILRTYKDDACTHIEEVPVEKLDTILDGLKDWILWIEHGNTFSNEEYEIHHKKLAKSMRLLTNMMATLWW